MKVLHAFKNADPNDTYQFKYMFSRACSLGSDLLQPTKMFSCMSGGCSPKMISF